jgi:hypothetical protein
MSPAGPLVRCLCVLSRACAQVLYLSEGYECQEFNSVFMLTFPSNALAVRFGLILQQLLLVCDWPEQVLELPNFGTQLGKDGQARADGRLFMHVCSY